jgi:thioredoxin-related protein
MIYIMNTRILIITILFLGCVVFYADAQDSNKKVKWLSFEEAVDLQQQDARKIVVYVFSNSCGWCRKMERETFSNARVIEYLNENFYPVKINKDLKSEIRYGNRSFKYIPADRNKKIPAYHELIYVLLEGRLAFPSVAYIDENMVYMGVKRGFSSPDPFLELLEALDRDGVLGV